MRRPDELEVLAALVDLDAEGSPEPHAHDVAERLDTEDRVLGHILQRLVDQALVASVGKTIRSQYVVGAAWDRVRLLPAGRERVRESRGHDPTADVVWSALRSVAPPFSDFEQQINAVSADYEQRGMFRSGGSVYAAKRLAHQHGYEWDAAAGAFRRPWYRAAAAPTAIVAGLVTAGVATWASELRRQRRGHGYHQRGNDRRCVRRRRCCHPAPVSPR